MCFFSRRHREDVGSGQIGWTALHLARYQASGFGQVVSQDGLS
jgi:hypothetical protein